MARNASRIAPAAPAVESLEQRVDRIERALVAAIALVGPGSAPPAPPLPTDKELEAFIEAATEMAAIRLNAATRVQRSGTATGR